MKIPPWGERLIQKPIEKIVEVQHGKLKRAIEQLDQTGQMPTHETPELKQIEARIQSILDEAENDLRVDKFSPENLKGGGEDMDFIKKKLKFWALDKWSEVVQRGVEAKLISKTLESQLFGLYKTLRKNAGVITRSDPAELNRQADLLEAKQEKERDRYIALLHQLSLTDASLKDPVEGARRIKAFELTGPFATRQEKILRLRQEAIKPSDPNTFYEKLDSYFRDRKLFLEKTFPKMLDEVKNKLEVPRWEALKNRYVATIDILKEDITEFEVRIAEARRNYEEAKKFLRDQDLADIKDELDLEISNFEKIKSVIAVYEGYIVDINEVLQDIEEIRAQQEGIVKSFDIDYEENDQPVTPQQSGAPAQVGGTPTPQTGPATATAAQPAVPAQPTGVPTQQQPVAPQPGAPTEKKGLFRRMGSAIYRFYVKEEVTPVVNMDQRVAAANTAIAATASVEAPAPAVDPYAGLTPEQKAKKIKEEEATAKANKLKAEALEKTTAKDFYEMVYGHLNNPYAKKIEDKEKWDEEYASRTKEFIAYVGYDLRIFSITINNIIKLESIKNADHVRELKEIKEFLDEKLVKADGDRVAMLHEHADYLSFRDLIASAESLTFGLYPTTSKLIRDEYEKKKKKEEEKGNKQGRKGRKKEEEEEGDDDEE